MDATSDGIRLGWAKCCYFSLTFPSVSTDQMQMDTEPQMSLFFVSNDKYTSLPSLILNWAGEGGLCLLLLLLNKVAILNKVMFFLHFFFLLR